MTWANFFLGCFVFGFVLSAVAFLAGSAHLHFHVHHGGHGGHGGVGSKLNFGTLAAFIMWFGGTGAILLHLSGIGLAVAIVVATIAGVAGATVIWWFAARVLAPGDRPLDPADYRLTGSVGYVSAAVRPNGTGEMILVQQGRRQGVPIRSENGKALAAGAEVVVTRYEGGIAYVREWEEFTS
jgi:membrane protein implicated in regulation of membrane protease activity